MSTVTGLAVEALQRRVDALERIAATQADVLSAQRTRMAALQDRADRDHAELQTLRRYVRAHETLHRLSGTGSGGRLGRLGEREGE